MTSERKVVDPLSTSDGVNKLDLLIEMVSALRDQMASVAEQIEAMRPADASVSPIPTPWRVVCPRHGLMYLSKSEYDRQTAKLRSEWLCPVCHMPAEFDYSLAENVSKKGREP